MLRKRAIIAGLGTITAVVLAGPLAYAGEPVQMKGSTSLELPKPTPELNENHKLNYGNNKGSQDLQGGFVPPPSIQGSKLLDKKARELIDKNRNWIFVNPYETHYDEKTENFMKGEKGTGLFDQRWMNDSEQKTQVEKFMEEKDQTRGNNNRDGDDRDSDSSGPGGSGSGKGGPRFDKPGSDIFGLRNDGDKDGEDSASPKNIFSTPGLPFGKPAGLDDIFSASSDSKASRMSNPFLPDRGPQSSVFDKDALKKDQEKHDLEFGKFLSEPRGTPFSLPGGADVLNNSLDATRFATEPTAPHRVDQILNFGRSDSPVFSSGISSGLSSGLNPSRSSIDFSAKEISRAPSFIAPAAVAPTVQAPTFSASPFQLPFPQRKF